MNCPSLNPQAAINFFSRIAFMLLKVLHKYKISMAQLAILSELNNVSHITMTDISKKMNHSTAAATGLIDYLEKLGFVQRVHAQDDRRKVLVFITRVGKDFLQVAADAIRDQTLDDPGNSLLLIVTQLFQRDATDTEPFELKHAS